MSEEREKEHQKDGQNENDVKKTEPPENKTDKQIDIETPNSGQRIKLIVSIAWPALAENFLTSIMSMVGMIMVGGLGAYAIAAVGLVTQPRFLMMAAFTAMNVGTTALVAQSKGARNPDGANNALNQSIMLNLGLTAIICIIMTIFSEQLIRMLAGSEISEQTVQESIRYLRIQIYGFPATSLTFTMNAALRGAGNTRATFYNNTVANIVNVALAYCLINGHFGFPRMEVAGASLALVIAQSVGLLMALRVLLEGKQYIRLRFGKFWKIDTSMMKRISRIGLPSFAEQALMRIGAMWFVTIVTSLGDLAYAAHMVTMNIQQLAFTTGMAFGVAATTLVGQTIGRARTDLTRVYVRVIQTMGFVVSVLIAIVMFTMGQPIAGLYSNDAVIIALAADMLKIIAIVNPIMNARFIYSHALYGAGDAKFMAVVTGVGVLMVRPLVGLLLVNVFHMGLTGVWIALSSDLSVSWLITWIRYKKGKWALIKI